MVRTKNIRFNGIKYINGDNIMFAIVPKNPLSNGLRNGVNNIEGFTIPKPTSTIVTNDKNTNTPQIFCVLDLNFNAPLNIAKLCSLAMIFNFF